MMMDFGSQDLQNHLEDQSSCLPLELNVAVHRVLHLTLNVVIIDYYLLSAETERDFAAHFYD